MKEGKVMDWIEGLQRVIDYMEEHLEDDIDFAEAAKEAYSSSFHFQRIFHIICGYTMGEYIRYRRLTRAAIDLSNGNEKVIDVALKYGYNNPESFCRAFTKFHGVSPIQAKNSNVHLKSFSRLSVKITLEGGSTMDYRIENLESFKIAAKRINCKGTGEITQKSIHQVWEVCNQERIIDRLCKYVQPDSSFGNAVLGVCFNNPDAGDFDYAIGMVTDQNQVEEGLTIEEIPANTWIVFPFQGKLPEAFQTLYKKIYTEFFPGSNYQPAEGFCIEVYPSADHVKNDYKFEVWLSVKEK